MYGEGRNYFGDVIEPIIVPRWDIAALDWWTHTLLVISTLARAVAQQDIVLWELLGVRWCERGSLTDICTQNG